MPPCMVLSLPSILAWHFLASALSSVKFSLLDLLLYYNRFLPLLQAVNATAVPTDSVTSLYGPVLGGAAALVTSLAVLLRLCIWVRPR